MAAWPPTTAGCSVLCSNRHHAAEPANAENTAGRNVGGGYRKRERRSKCHERRGYQIGGDCLGSGHWRKLLAHRKCYATCAQRSSDRDYQSYKEIIQPY